MAKKRKGLTDDVSLDVKLQTGAIVSLKVKNLRTGAIKLLSFSISDLFETENSEQEAVTEESSSVPDSGESQNSETSKKFRGNEDLNYDQISVEEGKEHKDD